MRSKEFDGWDEAKECWRKTQNLNAKGRSGVCFGIAFERVQNLYNHWWVNCAANKHGWDITIKARGVRK
jgi:hypothetical protein